MQTVFFGPFIGEFGWELLYWQGWVRRVCRTHYRDYPKIAASYPGRYPFYTDVDEFWPIPSSFVDLRVSGHGYCADGWRSGYPGVNVPKFTFRGALRAFFRSCPYEPEWSEVPVSTPDIAPHAERILEEFKSRLPDDTLFFVPWRWNRCDPEGLEFGTRIPEEGRPSHARIVVQSIDPEHQLFERLEPTLAGQQEYRARVPEERKHLAVFARHRALRRPDKNWPVEKYVELVRRLQNLWPELQVTILGEPGGTYFSDGVPEGCLDLIQIPSAKRMDVQISALRRSVMAVGSTSGGIQFGLATGCPAVHWGYNVHQPAVQRANFTATPMIYYADVDPSVDTVCTLLRHLESMLRNWSRPQLPAVEGGRPGGDLAKA